jgi:hypothetical protein
MYVKSNEREASFEIPRKAVNVQFASICFPSE